MADVVLSGTYRVDLESNTMWSKLTGVSTGATQVQLIFPLPRLETSKKYRLMTSSFYQNSGGALTAYLVVADRFDATSGIGDNILLDSKSFTHQVYDSFDIPATEVIIPGGWCICAYITFAAGSKTAVAHFAFEVLK